MKDKININITPRLDCKTCWSKGIVKGSSVPVPFGSGSCSLPDEFCDCVIEQVPDGENEYNIILKFTDGEIWKAGKCGGTIVSDTPNHYATDDSIKYYGGYLVAESIGYEKHMRLIIAAPEMFRVLERALPIVAAEAQMRDEAHADPRTVAAPEYYTEMHELMNAITAALYLVRYGVIPEPPADDYQDENPDDEDFDLAMQDPAVDTNQERSK